MACLSELDPGLVIGSLLIGFSIPIEQQMPLREPQDL
jgi:hypothetical protein